MPLVRATEAGIARTEGSNFTWTIVVAEHLGDVHNESRLESRAIEGDSPLRCVADLINYPQASSLLGTGGRRWEVSNSQGSIQPITDSEEVV